MKLLNGQRGWRRMESGDMAVEVEALPGCISQGKSREEALTNIKEAIGLYVAALREDNLAVPGSLY